MIRLKTAILFAAGLKIGGILGGASGEDADHLYNFGIRLGIAFQLKDDYLDVYGDSLVFGKNLGGDILSNKKTYLLIKAIECANGFQTGELKKWLKAANYDPQDKITAVIDIYNQLEIKKICENKIQEYYTRALEDLKAVTVDPAKRIELRSLVQHLMCREL
jgi:geranylgeranyl diphosphate synthase type II